MATAYAGDGGGAMAMQEGMQVEGETAHTMIVRPRRARIRRSLH
jgi:hypothetical protein